MKTMPARTRPATATAPASSQSPGGRIPATRLALVALAALLFLTIVFVLSGASWPVVLLYRLPVEGGMVVLWVASAAGLGATLLHPLWPPFPLIRERVETSAGETTKRSEPSPPSLVVPGEGGRNSPLRFVTACAVGFGTLSLLILAFGLAGILNRATAWAVLAPGLCLGLRALLRSGLPSQSGIVDWLKEPAGCQWLWLATMPFLSMAFVAAMAPPGILWNHGEPHGYDVVEYHLQVPREWYEGGRIRPLAHNVFSYLPFSAEMHDLLAMELRGGPYAGMYLAQLMSLAFAMLTVLAIFAIASRNGRQAGAVRAAVAAASVPWMAQLGSVAYVESSFLLFSTLAAGWSLWALESEQRRLRNFAVAGAMAGFAAGAKLTAVPEVLLAIPAIAIALLALQPYKKTRDASSARRLGLVVAGSAVLLGAGLLVLAPWLIRTWLWSGNPVFPEAASLFGHGSFSPVQVERWDASLAPAPGARSVMGRFHAGWVQVLVNWQYGWILLPLAFVIFVLRRRDTDAKFLGAMLLWLWLFWLAFTHLQGRFFILAVPLCALLLARPMNARWSGLIATAVLAMAVLNGGMLAANLSGYLYGPGGAGLASAGALGVEDLSWLAPILEKVPTSTPVFLVGDARAFWYSIPMPRLHYRTVFDVDSGRESDLLSAWCGGRTPTDSQAILIDPLELKRLCDTYFGLQDRDLLDRVLREAPRDERGRPTPFLLKRGRD